MFSYSLLYLPLTCQLEFLGYLADNKHIQFMGKRALRRYMKALLVMAVIAGVVTVPAFATSSSSQNYQIVEQEFGAGSSLESCSGSYCARTTIGDLAVGAAAAGESTAEFGSVTPDEPSLQVIIDPGESHLGELTTENTASKTMVVRVRSYLSNGYHLQITGEPPKYKNHTLATPTSPTASLAGKEQFAINATANTVPDVGANPLQLPSNDFSFGEVDEDYATPNLFKYESGDVVARSATESGQTEYTISMIVNIANSTPAGHYSGDYSAVVVPYY